MTVFVKNKSGIVQETTEAIAEMLVGRGDVEYVTPEKEPKKEKEPKEVK